MQGRALARRRIGALACLSPVLLLLVSLGCGLSKPQDPLPGLAVMGVAGAVALLNVWLSFGRGWLHMARGRDPSSHRHVSGLPMIGTILAVAGYLASFGSIATTALGLAVLAIDTGGTPWFLAATWNDESLWAGS